MQFTPKSQAKTPLLDAVRQYVNLPHAAFYTPGHKQGKGISPSFSELLGAAVFRADLSELPGLDNLHAPSGAIQEAQELAAEAFGAEATWFLANGSTSGIIAAILATCGAGDKIILPRNIHQCAIAGLILSGAIPIFISPEYDPVLDITGSIVPAAVAAALEKHPDAKAVMMVYPTYNGVCGDVAAIARLVHQHGIPLLVDEAHGAHFQFHSNLPPTALSGGADLTVQSTHKVLGALTQAAMLHVQGGKIDRERLSKTLRLVQSSSPSYLLLASLDAARQQMALSGEELMGKTLALAEVARSQIAQIPGLSVLENLKSSPGFIALDNTRLTINVSAWGISGFEVDEQLTALGVLSELPSLQNITSIVSLGNVPADINHLVAALTTISQGKHPNLEASPWQDIFQQWQSEILHVHPSSFVLQPAISPREAFFAPTVALPLEQAIECISAELVCPYPPGIPVLMPGEAIAPAAIDYLRQIVTLGGSITGCSDPSIQTLKVVQINQ